MNAGTVTAWIVGLALTLGVGHVVVKLFIDTLRKYMRLSTKPPLPGDLRGVPDWITGGLERVFFACMVAVNVAGYAPAMITWLVVKLAMNWNWSGTRGHEVSALEAAQTRMFAFSALLGGLLSMLMAFCGGLFISWLSCRLS